MTRTVLIVDDHPGYRAAARTVLEMDGFEVVGESATGLEGVSEAARLRPQIVLLDIGLPDIDGIEVARRIMSAAAGGDVPAIVLVSSRDGTGCETVFASCGARGFIPKAELTGDAITALAA
ncbi:MAG: response regulator transcription factor [Thermoleophilia bacterium]|nr:response regulator transcription factor [Thermoleophilia bacterium]